MGFSIFLATRPNSSSVQIVSDINIARAQNTPGRRPNRGGPFCRQNPKLMPNGKGGGAFVAAPYSPSPLPALPIFPLSFTNGVCSLRGEERKVPAAENRWGRGEIPTPARFSGSLHQYIRGFTIYVRRHWAQIWLLFCRVPFLPLKYPIFGYFLGAIFLEKSPILAKNWPATF